MDPKQLREKRNRLVTEARAISDRYTNGEAWSAEDEQRFDALHADAQKLKEQIDRAERQEALEAEMRASTGTIAGQQNRSGRDGDDGGSPDAEQRIAAMLDERDRALRSFVRSGSSRDGHYSARALQVDSGPDGGNIVRAERFVEQLIKAVDDLVFIRQMATTHLVTDAQSLGVPTLDTDPADADWTVELGTGNEDASMAFGKRSLYPHPLAKRLKVSRALLQRAALPAEQIVRDRLAYKFAVTQEKAFLTGSGAQQPLGVFTASNDGIPTSRDISTGNTTTEITADGLIEAKYGLKGQYWERAAWMFHRDGLKQIAKQKDGEGRYMWEPSRVAGQPDRLLNMPFMMSEFAPNTFTNGQYVGILGDWSTYWIADAMTFELQRLVELYAETNQIGFIGRLETDGMPTLAEAFVRVKLA